MISLLWIFGSVLSNVKFWKSALCDVIKKRMTSRCDTCSFHLLAILFLSPFKHLAGSIKHDNRVFSQEDVNRGLNMMAFLMITDVWYSKHWAVIFWWNRGSIEECWRVAAGQLCSECECWTFGAVQKERQGGLRQGWVQGVVPRDEGEVRKHFGQSFLWNVTESRALWEGDDDAGIFPTASLKRKDSYYNEKHAQAKGVTRWVCENSPER